MEDTDTLKAFPGPLTPGHLSGEREGQDCALDQLKDLDYSSESFQISVSRLLSVSCNVKVISVS